MNQKTIVLRLNGTTGICLSFDVDNETGI